MKTSVSLHIDPEHEYGFTLTRDGKSSHFTYLPNLQDFRHFPEVRRVPRALLDAVAALAWAANTGAITGPQFFAAGRGLGLGRYKFDTSPQTYTFTYQDTPFTVVAANSYDAIDAATDHFGLPETFAHWCWDASTANPTFSA